MVNLVIRGYAWVSVDGNPQPERVTRFEETHHIPEFDLDTVLPELGEQHALKMVSDKLHMIEIEFMDEPDPLQRFMRFGTAPLGMVEPVAVKL